MIVLHALRYGGALVLFLFCFFAMRDLDQRPSGPLVPASVAEQGEELESRESFEQMRLRDPGTGVIPRGIREKELAFAAGLPTKEAALQKAERFLAKTSGATLVSWTHRGPSNMGGRTRALAYDFTNPNTILAGGVSGGMWRTTNGGSAWSKTTGVSQLHSVTCIAQDTRAGKTSTWYFGTGEYRGNSASAPSAGYAGDGIYKSTNGGQSWSVLAATASGTPHLFDSSFDYIFNVVTDPVAAQDVVYAATSMGIRRSTDGGGSWTTALGGFGNGFPRYTDIARTPGGALYATLSDLAVGGTTGASGRGIYRSPDGVTWTSIVPAGFPGAYQRIVVAVAPSNANIVYFLVAGANGVEGTDQINTHQFWKYTYLSGDGSGAGGTWENRGKNLPNETGLSGNAQFDTQNSYDMIVRAKPDNPDFVVVGGTNLYRSTDGFATTTNWARIGGYNTPSTYQWWPNQHPDQHAGFFLTDSPATFVSGNDGGLARTTDVTASTVVWSSLNNGYLTTQYYSVALDRSTPGSNVIVGGMQDNGTWFVNSAASTPPWLAILGGDGSACAIASGASSYYMSSQNGVVYRMILDGSGNLTSFTRVDPTGGTGYLFINPFVLDPSDNRVMYLAGGVSLWRNTDLTGITMGSNSTTATNWTNLTGAGVGSAQISGFGVSTAAPASRLYYGTSDGRLFRLDNAKTATTGSVPVDIWTGKGFPASAYVSCVAVDPANGDQAVVVFTNYSVVSLFATTDAGVSWTPVAGNLEQNVNGSGNGPSCRFVTIVPAGSARTYFVGTSAGLYSTQTLAGTSTVWVQEGAASIGNVVVDQLDARVSDGTVVVGTHGYGVFGGVVAATAVGDGFAGPSETALLQNYPNPFNPSTMIGFRLALAGDVALEIFDVAGRRVAVLAAGQFEAGEHAVRWVPKDLSSGTYVYRLSSGSTKITRKLLFVK